MKTPKPIPPPDVATSSPVARRTRKAPPPDIGVAAPTAPTLQRAFQAAPNGAGHLQRRAFTPSPAALPPQAMHAPLAPVPVSTPRPSGPSPAGILEFLQGAANTAVDLGTKGAHTVVEHGPTALRVGGGLVAAGGAITAGVSGALLQPEIAAPAAAIGGAGAGVAALGAALEGGPVDAGTMAKGAAGVAGLFAPAPAAA